MNIPLLCSTSAGGRFILIFKHLKLATLEFTAGYTLLSERLDSYLQINA